MMTLAQRSLEIAISQLGVTEQPKGSNAGPEVKQYLKSVGLGVGNPWCMAFVYWCVDQACKEMGLKNPLVKTGSVMFQYNNTTLRKLPKTSSAIKPGDIGIMSFKGGKGHTFFIKHPGATLWTVEGNTNDEGGREGYEVAIMKRPVSSLHGVIQLP